MDLLYILSSHQGIGVDAFRRQVSGTLPSAFKDKFLIRYAIIDCSEIFIETPSDLHLQSSTLSQYKHHNTTKMLIACTPNGAICFVSTLYVGSISDIEITQVFQETKGQVRNFDYGRQGIFYKGSVK